MDLSECPRTYPIQPEIRPPVPPNTRPEVAPKIRHPGTRPGDDGFEATDRIQEGHRLVKLTN
jgi:hypothetical protein